jgi:signal peptidase I
VLAAIALVGARLKRGVRWLVKSIGLFAARPAALFLCLLLSAGAGAEEHFYRMPTTAMEPTFPRGAVIVVRPLGTDELFARGMIVVYRIPQTDGRLGVKRVIGLPGEMVEIRSKHVFVNGKPLDEPYALITNEPLPTFSGKVPPDVLRRRDDMPPLVVPQDSVFLLGDNRDAAWDSRFFGAVKRTEVTGVVIDWHVPPAT